MIERKLIFMDAKSSKFWNIRQEGSSHTVTYGRTGSAGQESTKNFDSEALAQKDAEKLIKEKLGKGYVDAAAEPPKDGQLPSIAFGSVSTQDDISSNLGTFVGMRVLDYDMEKPARSDVAYRFRSDWDDNVLEPALEHFFATDAALESTAIVIGAWHGDNSEVSSAAVINLLINHRARIPKLAAIYLGDITSEENEMSWIIQSDVTPLLQAFPKLQLLRTRGGTELKLSPISHTHLRALAIETGGLDASILQSIFSCDFPELEYLELWLGTEEYGANTTVEHLQPLLSGRLFPKLKYLGLRNSQMADQIAAVVVNSPLVQRLDVLDLSLGVLSDEGGESLLNLHQSPLKKLNLHHHFISSEVVRKLRALPFAVDTSGDNSEEDEEDRFVAVGE